MKGYYVKIVLGKVSHSHKQKIVVGWEQVYYNQATKYILETIWILFPLTYWSLQNKFQKDLNNESPQATDLKLGIRSCGGLQLKKQIYIFPKKLPLCTIAQSM